MMKPLTSTPRRPLSRSASRRVQNTRRRQPLRQWASWVSRARLINTMQGTGRLTVLHGAHSCQSGDPRLARKNAPSSRDAHQPPPTRRNMSTSACTAHSAFKCPAFRSSDSFPVTSRPVRSSSDTLCCRVASPRSHLMTSSPATSTSRGFGTFAPQLNRGSHQTPAERRAHFRRVQGLAPRSAPSLSARSQ